MATASDVPPEQQQDSRIGGEMTLLEHLLELRSRVFWSAVAVVGGMLPFFAPPIGFWMIERLLDPAVNQNPDFRAQAITPMENIVVYFRVALLGGITLGMPMLIYQVLRFVSPALTSGEKRWIFPVVTGASLAFATGIAFAYWVVLPAAYGFLFTFGSDIADPTPTISSYMDLTIRLILVMGFVFETPIIVMALAKFGVVSASKLWRWKPWALVAAFAISAVATPTPDPVTQTLVAAPMVVLYFVGIGLAWLVRRS